jgi:Na+/melibiose symporter-like transporter
MPKLLYAWGTYLLLRLIYAANNVPYASLTAVMTEDPDERNSIATYRQMFANTAGFIIGSLAVPMVKFLGGNNSALGYQLTMGILLSLSVIFFPHCLRCFEGGHSARSAAEDIGARRSRRPNQERPLGHSFSGDDLLFHGAFDSRQRNAALF